MSFKHRIPRILIEKPAQAKKNGAFNVGSIVLPNGLKFHQVEKSNSDVNAYCVENFGKNTKDLLDELKAILETQLSVVLLALSRIDKEIKNNTFVPDLKLRLESIESLMLDLAKQGYLDAQVQLALLYFVWGKYFGHAESDGLSWMEKAYKSGHSDAASELGTYFLRRNQFSKAYEFFHDGDKKGCAVCRYLLARMYEEGAHVEQNFEKAYALFKSAATAGHPQATVDMVKLVASGRVDKNLMSTPEELLHEAILDGNVDALTFLGHLYENGEMVEKRLDKAVYFFREAAVLGCPIAQLQYGYMLEKGKDIYPIEANLNEALLWYSRATEGKNIDVQRDAHFNLGNCFLKRGDRGNALLHLTKSHALGDHKAGIMLNQLKSISPFAKGAE